jgi:hypothetical protein
VSSQTNVFRFEDRIAELFGTLYPLAPPGQAQHPSGRAYKPIIESTLGALVPGGNDGRRLQMQREYVKLDFQDFIDYATSTLPPRPKLATFPDQTAVFYESLVVGPNANWANNTLSVTDAVVARDRVFVTVLMHFNVSTPSDNGTAKLGECGASITFAPESYSRETQIAGDLGEWERAMCWPPEPNDAEWRFINSGEYTSEILERMETDSNPPFSREALAKVRQNAELNYSKWGAFFEVVRLGLHLPSYVDFMYDLVVTERKQVDVARKKQPSLRRGKPVSFDKPVYKIIRSIRIIRPESATPEEVQFRNWTPPSYCFLVLGHWRKFADETRMGRDPEGNEVAGKTWVRQYRKYEQQDDGELETHALARDARVVIGIKQTLRHARDVIQASGIDVKPADGSAPSTEWMADERAKLTAGLRYAILKRDEFRCCKCGKNAAQDNFVRLEVDHKVPVSKWGRTIEDNLETICRDCNRGKSDGE